MMVTDVVVAKKFQSQMGSREWVVAEIGSRMDVVALNLLPR